MAVKQVIMTTEGVRKAEEELEVLKTVKRKEITEKIKVARGYGDLSENSEYDEAKNEQAIVEARIAELEAMLKNVKIIDDEEQKSNVVHLGTRLLLKDVEFDEEMEVKIVGSAEADPASGLISDDSPIGKALLGKKANRAKDIEVQTPQGVALFRILKIL